MPNFEELGKTVDREMEKLKVFIETEVKPGAKRGTLEALRAASARLAELANDLEKRFHESPEKPK